MKLKRFASEKKPERNDEICAMYEAGASLSDIAKKFGITPSAIKDIIHRRERHEFWANKDERISRLAPEMYDLVKELSAIFPLVRPNEENESETHKADVEALAKRLIALADRASYYVEVIDKEYRVPKYRRNR